MRATIVGLAVLAWAGGLAHAAPECSTEKQDCGAGAFCTEHWDEAAKRCPERGHCEPMPPAAELELALPFSAGERIYCAKGNLSPAETSHTACSPSTSWALDLASSAYDPPRIILAAADGVAHVRGGCTTSDLNHQTGPEHCNDGWGNWVRVQHSTDVYTQYAHLIGLLVDEGAAVKRGQPIGIEGNTGAAGPKHLHFSAHRGDALRGGPSIPIAKLRLRDRVVAARELRCIDIGRGEQPRDEVAIVSGTAVVARPAPRIDYVARRPFTCPASMRNEDGVCIAAPKDVSKAPILLFLNGMLAPPGFEWARGQLEALAAQATAAGYIFIAPTGRAGLCTWSPEVKDNLCWPSGENQAQSAQTIAAELGAALDEGVRKLGGTHKRFLAGFSNGGYFATYLVDRGLIAVDGVAILQGGIVEPMRRAADKVRWLLLSAKGDPWQGPRMKLLRDALGDRARFVEREGQHELRPSDFQAALDFFRGL